MNVLSLFDGISCGQIALQRAEIKVDKYFASEIDKNAIKVTQKNYPNTKQLGSVVDISGDDLPNIDLLIGGSPCQGFSFAGKQLNFDDERSKLFFEYVRLLKKTKPKYYLLENVVMKREYQDIISDYLGVKPIKINSALVSAQSRNRLYWTNIPHVKQPKDKGILLKDILNTTDFGISRDMPEDMIRKNIKTIIGNSKYKENFNWNYDKNGRILVTRPDGLKIQRIGRIAFPDNKSEILTTITQPYIVDGKLIVKEATKKGYTEIEDGDCFDLTFPKSKTRRGRNMKDKSNCLTAANYDFMRYEHPIYRKITTLEAARLQTVPDHYFDGLELSDSAIYKQLGNGWTVDVIAHILGHINEKI